jgi:hypothetical protein
MPLVLDGHSPLGYQLADTLEELSRMARTLRALSEEIDRQPNVLLFGREGPDGRPAARSWPALAL